MKARKIRRIAGARRFTTAQRAAAGAVGAAGVIAALVFGAAPALAAHPQMQPSVPMWSAQGQLSSLAEMPVASTVPSNGDTNPYGVAVVPISVGKLVAGDVLVANFNNSAGTAGAGTSIVEINPTTGATSTFYTDTNNTLVGPVAIAINPKNGIVWVGDYGSASGGSSGNVDVIAPTGVLKATFNSTTTAGSTDSPVFSGVWGQAFGDGAFFWTNAGNGSVWQLNPLQNVSGQPLGSTYSQLASGLAYTAGATAATAAGPQGLVYDAYTKTLYVTDDANNTIYAITGIGTGSTTTTTLVSGGMLNSPQGIALNPANGNLLVVNGAGNNDLLEYTTMGQLVAHRDLLPTQAPGALFGLAATTTSSGQPVIYFGNADNNMLYELSSRMGNGMMAATHGM